MIRNQKKKKKSPQGRGEFPSIGHFKIQVDMMILGVPSKVVFCNSMIPVLKMENP